MGLRSMVMVVVYIYFVEFDREILRWALCQLL
jgi:hypothetical protein